MNLTAHLLLVVLALDGGVGATEEVVTHDAGVKFFSGDLYAKCEPRDPLGIVEDHTADGGPLVWSAQQSRRAACLQDTCEGRRLQLEPVVLEGPGFQTWLKGVVIAGAVGFVLGFLVPVVWYVWKHPL